MLNREERRLLKSKRGRRRINAGLKADRVDKWKKNEKARDGLRNRS